MSTQPRPHALEPDPESQTLSRFMQEAERLYLEACLQVTGNNKTKAAALAGVSRSTMKDKVARYTVGVEVKLS